MRIDIISAVPEIFDSFLSTSIVKIAQERGLVKIFVHNLHKYSSDKFGHIDDTPYGGGSGMVIQCEPVFKCIEELKSQRDYDEVIYLTADGVLFNQSIANELSLKRNLILLCGHYKGIDQRIRDSLVTKEISIGDFILTGGELPAMIVVDSIVRLVPGVLGDPQSIFEDSFQDGLLEPPIYTKPAEFRGMKVPDVLLSGDHKKISQWRLEQSLKKTQERRPDLLK
ncbi:tRNA (guanosine(37)-N1)-methyltransferase TrmD [Bacteroidetes/Chlorobi group bacterium MS-B_bin-24]|nr:MAG: tRNA (guanosine(37)-N1)-methyltransferase TrmD [Bacteroidetes/Chlorobi group bacterium MS-B_bin-24]